MAGKKGKTGKSRARKRTQKQSDLIKEYRRVRGNYLSRLRAWSKKGFIFSDEATPAVPQKITQGSINRLKRYNEDIFRRASGYIDFYDNKLYTVPEGRKRYREDIKRLRGAGRVRLPEGYRQIIDNFYDLISTYVYGSPRRGETTDRRDFATRWLDNAIVSYGEKRVAVMLQMGKANGNWLSAREAYDEVRLANSLRQMGMALGADAADIQEATDSLASEFFGD